MKPPHVGSAKGIHQDSPYWPIEPMELCSCWFALDDATEENGCMIVYPGGHKRGHLPHVKVPDDFVIEEGVCNECDAISAPVNAGGGLFFHSLIPHATAPNRSNNWRRAIALSYMSSRSRFIPNLKSGNLKNYEDMPHGPVFFHVRGRTFPNCVR